jgi:hypothetical protein
VLDAALAACATRPEPAAEVERHVGLRGVRQARELVPLAGPRPDSPQESRLRLRCHDARLPAPALHLRVRDERREDRREDRRRHNFLEDDGWAMF